MRALVLALTLVAAPAAAHEDAKWIADGGYQTALGHSCCGVQDCQRVYDVHVSFGEDDKALVTMPGPDGDGMVEFKMLSKSIHVSENIDFWFCGGVLRDVAGQSTWAPRCLFIPTTAMR